MPSLVGSEMCIRDSHEGSTSGPTSPSQQQATHHSRVLSEMPGVCTHHYRTRLWAPISCHRTNTGCRRLHPICHTGVETSRSTGTPRQLPVSLNSSHLGSCGCWRPSCAIFPTEARVHTGAVDGIDDYTGVRMLVYSTSVSSLIRTCNMIRIPGPLVCRSW